MYGIWQRNITINEIIERKAGQLHHFYSGKYINVAKELIMPKYIVKKNGYEFEIFASLWTGREHVKYDNRIMSTKKLWIIQYS